MPPSPMPAWSCSRMSTTVSVAWSPAGFRPTPMPCAQPCARSGARDGPGIWSTCRSARVPCGCVARTRRRRRRAVLDPDADEAVLGAALDRVVAARLHGFGDAPEAALEAMLSELFDSGGRVLSAGQHETLVRTVADAWAFAARRAVRARGAGPRGRAQARAQAGRNRGPRTAARRVVAAARLGTLAGGVPRGAGDPRLHHPRSAALGGGEPAAGGAARPAEGPAGRRALGVRPGRAAAAAAAGGGLARRRAEPVRSAAGAGRAGCQRGGGAGGGARPLRRTFLHSARAAPAHHPGDGSHQQRQVVRGAGAAGAVRQRARFGAAAAAGARVPRGAGRPWRRRLARHRRGAHHRARQPAPRRHCGNVPAAQPGRGGDGGRGADAARPRPRCRLDRGDHGSAGARAVRAGLARLRADGAAHRRTVRRPARRDHPGAQGAAAGGLRSGAAGRARPRRRADRVLAPRGAGPAGRRCRRADGGWRWCTAR